MIDYGKFRLSLKHLEQRYGIHRSCDPAAPVECLGPLVRKPGDHDAVSRTRTSRGSPTPSSRGATGRTVTRDAPGFCRSSSHDEVRRHGHVITPGPLRRRAAAGRRR